MSDLKISSRLPVSEDKILDTLQIRKANEDDFDALENLQKELHGEWFEDSHADLGRAIDSGRAWVAVRGGEAVGYLLCELFGLEHRYFPDSIFLSELYVVPGARKKGVGTKLVLKALSEPWPKEDEYFSLTHAPDESHLTEYYERFGFKECGQTDAGNVMMTRSR
jgi:predicted N-acetyltransferase YhbS